jgi:hypothetical protein
MWGTRLLWRGWSPKNAASKPSALASAKKMLKMREKREKGLTDNRSKRVSPLFHEGVQIL